MGGGRSAGTGAGVECRLWPAPRDCLARRLPRGCANWTNRFRNVQRKQLECVSREEADDR